MVQPTHLQTTRPHCKRAPNNALPSAPSASPAKKAAKQAVKVIAQKDVARVALMAEPMAVVSAANVVAEAADAVIVTIAPKAAHQLMAPTTCKVQA